MKKTTFLYTLLLIALNYSCNKETLIKNPSINENIELSDGIKLKKSPISIKEITQNNNDIQDKKINETLLTFGSNIRGLFNNTLPIELISLSKKRVDHMINADEFLKIMKKNNSDKSIEYDLIKDIKKYNMDYTHNGVTTQYTPAIQFLNSEIADISKNPIIAFPIEVNSDLAIFKKHENYIVGWVLNDDNTYCEIILGEKEANKTTHPVLIINNVLKDESFNDIEREKPSNLEKGLGFNIRPLPPLDFIVDQYKINYRYENSGRSEYSYDYLLLYGGTAGTSIWPSPTDRKEIKEISASEIGINFYDDKLIPEAHLTGPGLYANTYKYSNLLGVYIVTFEYDWYATKHPVTWSDGTAVANGVCAKRKYTHETYQKIYVPKNFNPISSNEKGYIKVKKEAQ